MLNFIIWNGSPIVFSIGPFVLRWYVLLFILGFFIARFLLPRIYKKEGKPSADLEALTIYILMAAVDRRKAWIRAFLRAEYNFDKTNGGFPSVSISTFLPVHGNRTTFRIRWRYRSNACDLDIQPKGQTRVKIIFRYLTVL